MRKKISAKILVLVGVLFAAGAAGIIMGMILINSMNCLLYTSPSPRD